MVVVRKRIGIFTFCECWNEIDIKKFRFLILRSYLSINEHRSLFFFYREKYMTVVNDLTLDPNLILKNINRQTRNAIRQARNYGIQCRMGMQLDRFIKFYNQFANTIRIVPSRLDELESIGSSLFISYSSLNGTICCAHSYLVDRKNKRVTLYQSASARYFSLVYEPKIIGIANKLLHYEDILFFKSLGFEIYDFGGYFEYLNGNNKRGLNEFKLLFGGTISNQFQYFSLPLYFLKKLKRFLYK